MCAGRAGRADRVVGSTESMGHAHGTSSRVDEDTRDKEGREASQLVLGKKNACLCEICGAAHAGTESNTGGLEREKLGRRCKLCVMEGLRARGGKEMVR